MLTGNIEQPEDDLNEKMMVVKLLKLVTGELIISHMMELSKKSKSILLDVPMTIVEIVSRDRRGHLVTSLGSKAWIEYCDETQFQIPKSSIVTIVEPDEELVHQYMGAKLRFEKSRIDEEMEAAQEDLEIAKEEFQQRTLEQKTPEVKPVKKEDPEDDLDSGGWQHKPRFNTGI